VRRRKGLRAQLLAGVEPEWLRIHPRRTYVRAVTLSVPDWVDWASVQTFHTLKRQLTAATGVEHVVDHIVPLNHPYVCGLTVPWNLRVVTQRQNAAKGNEFNPDQLAFDY
jgi:5-methylcytosine-specific restriction endonuclease McrA